MLKAKYDERLGWIVKKKKEKEIKKPKPRPRLNNLGYPLNDPYGLAEAFTRVGPKKKDK